MTIPPTGDHRASVDGKQFETFVADVLRSLGDGLDDFRLEEQELVVTDDGRYRIDITVRFTALGVEFLMLVECKDHARPVEREDVQALADKKRTAGAHKRVSRLNPSSEWITTDVPHLRIVPDELWSAARARQGQARRAIASTGKLAAANRPRYLFSGLTKCGVCGAGFILGSANRSRASVRAIRARARTG